jgi:hypothetical protein
MRPHHDVLTWQITGSRNQAHLGTLLVSFVRPELYYQMEIDT